MAFYDSVKDRVRNDGKKDEGEDRKEDDKKGEGKVAFDQLIKDSKDRKRDLEPEDEDSIEDFTNGGGRIKGDYGDLSSIEMKDEGSPQAGRGSEGSSGMKKSGGQVSEDTGVSENTVNPSSDPEEVMLTAGGDVKSPDEEDAEDAGNTEKALLRQIRDQNREIVKLLRSIDSSLS